MQRPEVYVVENVPGMKKFPVVMEAMSKLPDYYVSVFCPVQTEKFLPQRRDRLILIGSRKYFLWREPESTNRIKLKDDIAPTCVAHYSKDRGTRLVKDKFHSKGLCPYTTREYARLQGVPDWFTFTGNDSQVYKQIGNGVPVVFGEWIGREIKRYFGR